MKGGIVHNRTKRSTSSINISQQQQQQQQQQKQKQQATLAEHTTKHASHEPAPPPLASTDFNSITPSHIPVSHHNSNNNNSNYQATTIGGSLGSTNSSYQNSSSLTFSLSNHTSNNNKQNSKNSSHNHNYHTNEQQHNHTNASASSSSSSSSSISNNRRFTNVLSFIPYLARNIRRTINSQIFHLTSICLTLLAILLAIVAKTLFERNTASKSLTTHYLAFALCSLYILLSAWFCFEVSLRMIFNGAHFFWRENKGLRIRNLIEFLIVWLSFAIDLYAYVRLASSIVVVAKRDQMVTSTLLGSIITLRLAIFLMATPSLHSLIRQVKNAFEHVLIVLLFCGCLLYGVSLLSYFLFSPHLFNSSGGSSTEDCEVCRQRFNNIENAFFAMLQVISADGWTSDIVQLMCEQSSYSCAFVWLYFGSIECFSLFILLNVFTGVIFESLLQQNSNPVPKKSNYAILKDMACGLCLMSKYVAKRQRHEDDPKTTSRVLKKLVSVVDVTSLPDEEDEDDDEVESESDDEAFRFTMLDSANDRRHKEVMKLLLNMNREMGTMKRELSVLKRQVSTMNNEEE